MFYLILACHAWAYKKRLKPKFRVDLLSQVEKIKTVALFN